MNRNSSFPPPTKRVGGWPFRFSLTIFLIAAGLAVASLAFLVITSPTSRDNKLAQTESKDSESADSPAGSSTWSTWFDQKSDETPNPEEGENSIREFSTEVMDHVSKFETPTVKEVIDRLHAMGDYSGIGAFNPPGTRPALIGLAVPEDFVLPEGYVRHHQATDDGQRIEAILMFAPDYEHRDASNQPIAIPENRVVPPELAPRGLPHRRIVVPRPVGPDGYDL